MFDRQVSGALWAGARSVVLVVAATAFVSGAVVAPVAAVVAHRFVDVPLDTTHAQAIEWLAGAGVTAGCGVDAFCPHEPVSREQLATLLYRLSGNDPSVGSIVDAASIQGLTAEDVRGQDGAQGPRGPSGPRGADGSDGLVGYEVVTNPLEDRSFVAASGRRGFTARCPGDKVVLGGGYELSDAGAATVLGSFPFANDSGVFNAYVVTIQPVVDASITVYAMCASLTP